MTDREKLKREIDILNKDILKLEATITELTPKDATLALERANKLQQWHTNNLNDKELEQARNAHSKVATPLGHARFELEKSIKQLKALTEMLQKLERESDIE